MPSPTAPLICHSALRTTQRGSPDCDRLRDDALSCVYLKRSHEQTYCKISKILRKIFSKSPFHGYICLSKQSGNTVQDILQGLNTAQREAVINYRRPSLIIAGAGSGKTRVLTSRIAYMLAEGIAPQSILALTFTNKAAAEMRQRIEQIAGRNARYIRMGTFHSVFARILRENAERIGYPQTYTIYEPNDVKNLIKTIIKELNLPEERYKPAVAAARISMAKNCLVTPGAYVANTIYAAEDRQRQQPELGSIYTAYAARAKRNGAMDFDDLLLQTNILLRDCPDVLERYQRLFEYILVDEYQDTNFAQYAIIRRLAQMHGNVCVVGDDAQSIYSFRGAKIENILSFKRDYPDAAIYKLEQNYRSTQTIVNAANSLIVHNAHRMDKKCFSEGEKGEKIRLVKAYTDREEAEMIVSAIRDKIRSTGDEWSDVAVLYRTNAQSQSIEEALRRKGVPYRIYKGNSFFDHKEIRDMLGYIRLVVNPHDDEAFKRIVNYPARGIGDTTVGRIAQIAAARGISMWEAVDEMTGQPCVDAVERTLVRKVKEFVELIRSLSLVRSEKGLYDFGMEVASRSGILTALRAENTPESASAVDNIEELLNTMQAFSEQRDAEIRGGEREPGETATVDEWLQSVMLLTDQDKSDEDSDSKVTLMTVHSAKGLEYKYVYIAGMEDNLFPSQMASESVEGLEEERRLFYVALTRAKCEAMLSYAEMRFRWGQMEFTRPSRFLSEIDPQYVDSEVGDDELRPERRWDDMPRGGRQEEPERGRAIDCFRRRSDARFRLRRSEADDFAAGGSERPTQRPAPGVVAAVRGIDPLRSGMRSVGVRPSQGGGASQMPAGACAYSVGERVSHPKFGGGEIVRIEELATDHKLVVSFDEWGEKTLLAKFAKLTKI